MRELCGVCFTCTVTGLLQKLMITWHKICHALGRGCSFSRSGTSKTIKIEVLVK